MTACRVTLIPGDGIGPEITEAVLHVLEAAGVAIEWDEQLAGVAALERDGTPLPEATLESFGRTGVALKGPLTTPVGTGFRSVNVALRREFDLYANVRPAKTILHGGRFEDVDIVLVRENTEGLYIGFEATIPVGDDPRAVAQSNAVVTRGEGGCQPVRTVAGGLFDVGPSGRDGGGGSRSRRAGSDAGGGRGAHAGPQRECYDHRVHRRRSWASWLNTSARGASGRWNYRSVTSAVRVARRSSVGPAASAGSRHWPARSSWVSMSWCECRRSPPHEWWARRPSRSGTCSPTSS